MLALTKLRELTLTEPSAPGRPSYVSAASGLVDLGDWLAVVADDELHLGMFAAHSNAPGHLLRLLEGTLPPGKAERKRQKPDLEVLMRLPDVPGRPRDMLLALGSGSTPERCRGIAVDLDGGGHMHGAPDIIDLEPLMAGLGERIADLNIEGATVQDGEFRLFHRGNNSFPDNFVVRLPLPALLDGLDTGRMARTEPIAIHRLDLGGIEGVPYSVTDAATLPNGRAIVTAVAEDTADAYADGACIGALVAILDRSLAVAGIWPLERPYKIEGVSARLEGKSFELMLVVDADDPEVAASLYAATIET
jgi:hypothetical protein